MKTYITPHQFYITGFSVSHIIFDNSHHATLWASTRINDQIANVNLLLTFEKLNDILRFNGDMGEKIQLLMVNEMMSAYKPPFIIDIVETIGSNAVFTNCKLKLGWLQPENESIELQETPCLLVLDLLPINIIQQAKNLAQHIKDFCMPTLVNNSIEKCSIDQLCQMYKYYKGLLELDINEKAAREKAQLTDNRLFAMAQSAHKAL